MNCYKLKQIILIINNDQYKSNKELENEKNTIISYDNKSLNYIYNEYNDKLNNNNEIQNKDNNIIINNSNVPTNPYSQDYDNCEYNLDSDNDKDYLDIITDEYIHPEEL